MAHPLRKAGRAAGHVASLVGTAQRATRQASAEAQLHADPLPIRALLTCACTAVIIRAAGYTWRSKACGNRYAAGPLYTLYL